MRALQLFFACILFFDDDDALDFLKEVMKMRSITWKEITDIMAEGENKLIDAKTDKRKLKKDSKFEKESAEAQSDE